MMTTTIAKQGRAVDMDGWYIYEDIATGYTWQGGADEIDQMIAQWCGHESACDCTSGYTTEQIDRVQLAGQWLD